MSFTDNYLELRKKKKKKEEVSRPIEAPLFVNKTAALYAQDDIAPVKTASKKEYTNLKSSGDTFRSTKKKEEKEDDGRSWFQKGAFEDGYQFGDVTKAILGTETDVRENLAAGILGMGENVVDAGAYVAGGVGKAFGADEFAEKTKKFISKDLYDEEKIAEKIIFGWGFDADESSVLGEKTDSLVQSGGQLGATIGLQMAGVPWFVTTGVTSFGGEVEGAFDEDATYGEAGVSAAISAGAEILTEKLSGGIKFGGKALDDVYTKRIARGVSNKVVRTLSKLGMDMAGEGTEEVLSGVMSAVGQKITYADDKELTELFSTDEALESFIGGAVLGGSFGGINAVKSKAQGVDYASGLTANEKAVVDKVFEDRVAKEEKSGNLTEKQKDKIYDEVLNEMERGQIPTDTIEEVLGGKTYEDYSNTVLGEDTIFNEYEELGKKKDATLAEQTRYKELHDLIPEIKKESQREQLKSKLGEEVFGLVKGDRLAESYNERSRKGQAFEADLTKYDEKQQETIKKAAESGILNNTRRTHEFVDMIAKISADKGVLFDFTDNQKLKDSGFAIDGKDVNGYVTKDGITLNVNSAKALNSVVGHEITHVLEGTELYTELQNVLKTYAESKGEYQSRYDTLTKLYEGVKDANIDAELTADLVGDYLFTDSDFINNLSTNNRNVFQKIYDEVKYLCKVATAGSKEARELEKVKRAFEKAYKEGGKQTEGTQYSLGDGDYYSRISDMQVEVNRLTRDIQEMENSAEFKSKMSEIFAGDDIAKNIAEYQKWLENSGYGELKSKRDNLSKELERLRKEWDTKISNEAVNEENAAIAKSGLSEADYFRKQAVKEFGYTPYFYDAGYITTNGKMLNFSGEKGKHYGSRGQDHRAIGTIYADTDGTDALNRFVKDGNIRIMAESPGIDISTTTEPSKEQYATIGKFIREYANKEYFSVDLTGEDGRVVGSLTYENRINPTRILNDIKHYYATGEIRQQSDAERFRYSLSDSKGRELSPAVQERFANSKVVDENGNLKPVYHGTYNGEFSIFDKSKGYVEDDFGSGFYFSDNEADVSDHYEGGGPDYENKVARRAEQIADEEEIDYEEAEEKAREELFKGSHKFEVYLNIENPAIVGETMLLTTESYYEQYNEEDYDSYEDYEGDVEQLLSDDIDNIIWEVDKNVDFYDSSNLDGLRNVLWEAVNEGGIGVEELKKKINDLYLDNENGELVGNEIARQVIESLGYDGIIDPTVSSKWNMNIEEGTTHYIVFKPNQIKAVTNENPTDNPDIHRSLSANGEAPVRRGNYNVFGKDIALTQEETKVESEENLTSAPVSEETVAENETVEHSVSDLVDIAKQGRRENMRGAYNHNGKQYLSDGSFIAEFNTVDESLEQSNDFPIKQAIKELDESFARRVEGNYDLHTSDAKGFVKVGNSLFGSKRINAMIRAFENPVFSLANVRGGHEALVVTADNGRAVLMPVRASGNAYLAYEAQPIADTATFSDDLAPMDEAYDADRLASLDDADAPPEMEAPYMPQNKTTVDDPFENRDWYDIGNRKVKAYMYENPEVKPFFQAEAAVMLEELNSTTKGERWFNSKVDYEFGSEAAWGGVSRNTSDSIAQLLDDWKMSYADIEKGLNAIIEDNGAENIAAAKKIEFMLNDRLMNGYKSYVRWEPTMDKYGNVPANQEYLNLLNTKQINSYSKEAFNALMADADNYAPPTDDIAPVAKPEKVSTFEEVKTSKGGEVKGQQSLTKEDATKNEGKGVARVLSEEPKIDKKGSGAWSKFKNLVLDKGAVFEDLSLKTGNRELQARWNSIRYADGKAQRLIGEGNASVSSLNSIREAVEETGKTQQFYEYLYHLHNADRMTLEDRFKDTPNKPVFGDSVTADISRDAAAQLEKANPEFKQFAEEVYDYMNYLREQMVDSGIISNETAKLWAEMYPHYVPIRRVGDSGLNINVPLDTGKTGVNAPIKRATGGSRDILPLFDTMGQRTLQTYKAIAKNRFGVELKNTLGTTIESDAASLDELIDGVDTHDGLLQEGKDGMKPTFTVFEDGKRVTFEITDEMYDAMKPTSDALSGTSKTLNTISNVRRGTLTEYNPWFLLKNAVKDVQDVLINSQHATRTYAALPKAAWQMAHNGHWYEEYIENGGEQNSYFDSQTNTFEPKNTALEIAKTVTGLNAISKANNIVERLPRLAEYIASREAGRSVDVAMLDAARVTTNFAAGGDLTKFLNRNGATFLNASVQGAMQQARNIREAKMNGLKGWANLAAKFAIAGLPALALNHFLWDDDEEYEELSDYVKEGYYIVGKNNDGKFIRIPKGRTVAVIQSAFEQMQNLVTGDDEADLSSFLNLLVTNLAPNNPLDNNILSPIIQVANNETWYGEDLVPTRLQDLPAAEQYDESTDSISKWLGEKFDVSPYKMNYLLDQYSGVIGDTFLPMLTPEAESGDNSMRGQMLAPLKDMFTTDGVMKNQNVSDFYETVDELTKNAKSSKATDEDVLMSKYMNSVSSELSELYKKKREIQNSSLSDSAKYSAVREVQEQIVELTREGLNSYEDVFTSDTYATVADRHFRRNKDGEWEKITDKQLEKQEEVTSYLGISPTEYWGNKEEYDFAYEKPEKYAVAKSVGGYEAYKGYSSELYDIKGEDMDGDGRSDTGTRKENVIDWLNELDADYYTKIILFKSEYNADDTYNYEIIDYLNSREDISYEEMETILKELGFEVSNGNISW